MCGIVPEELYIYIFHHYTHTTVPAGAHPSSSRAAQKVCEGEGTEGCITGHRGEDDRPGVDRCMCAALCALLGPVSSSQAGLCLNDVEPHWDKYPSYVSHCSKKHRSIVFTAMLSFCDNCKSATYRSLRIMEQRHTSNALDNVHA